MKIIHCADLHLDSKMETNLTVGKAKERKLEILHTFERMADYAQEHGVSVIIIAGDMFDTARVMTSTKKRVLDVVKKYPQIDFLYLSGNHDESNFIATIEEVPTNLKVFGKNWTIFDYSGVKIAGVVLCDTNSATFYDTLQLPDDSLNIAVLHGQIGQFVTKDQTETINLNKLKNRNIDYLALGHVHSYTTGNLDRRGVYCYAGCLEGRGFDECGEKGFVLLDTDSGSIQSQFVPFAQRQLIETPFDITPYQDWYSIEEAIVAIAKNYAKENLLRVVLQGKYKIQLEKQLGMLEQKLDDFYLAKVKDESVLDVAMQDVAYDVSLRGEFIRQVLASNLSDKEKEQIILVGLRALTGEDL